MMNRPRQTTKSATNQLHRFSSCQLANWVPCAQLQSEIVPTGELVGDDDDDDQSAPPTPFPFYGERMSERGVI